MIVDSACVSSLFAEWPLLDRFAAAAAHGFRAVELWRQPPELHDAIVAAVERAGVTVSLLTLDPADPAASFDFAERLSCPRLYTLYGPGRPELPQLADLAAAARERGMSVLVEPVGGPPMTREHDVLFDVYHARRMEGDVVAAFERVAERVRHIHLSDYPGRVEPGAGELDFAALRAALERSGYAGTLGLEYHPTTTTAESLRGLARVGLAA